MGGVTESGEVACPAPSVAGRPDPVRERTAARRFLLVTLFLVGIWALLTAVADRASAEESPSGPVVETLSTVEESGITDPVEAPLPTESEGSGSGSESDTSGPDGDQVDQPDGTQPDPTAEPVDPPADDTAPPPTDNQPPKDNQPPDDGGEPIVVVTPVVDPVEPPPVPEAPVVVEPPPVEVPVVEAPPVEVLPEVVEPVVEVLPVEVVPDVSTTALEELVDVLVESALPAEPEPTTCAAEPSAITAALVQAVSLPVASLATNSAPTATVAGAHSSSIPLQTPLSSPLPTAPTGLPVAPSAPAPAGSTACATTSVSGSGSSSGDRHDSLAAALAAGLPAVLAMTAVDAPSAPAGDLAHCIADGTDRPD